MDILIKHIGTLYGILPAHILRLAGKDMNNVGEISNAWMLIKHGVIADFGEMDSCPALHDNCTVIDAENAVITPGFIDSHTHIAFPATREKEFEMKIKGASYAEIAAAGGGILNSALAMQGMDEVSLIRQAKDRIFECIGFGTVAFEIKSGYGLTTESELKQLRVIQALKKQVPVPLKATLLGAHALPKKYADNRQDYINKVLFEMIPQAVEQQLVDYIDVFCESGFFTTQETDLILKQGVKYGLKAKIHANQLAISGGVQVGIANNALSVDHLESMGENEIQALQQSETLPVALPGCSFYLNMPYAPGRKIIDAGLPLVLASDFNPGSCPSGNLLFVWSLACIQMKLSPNEAFNALTINAANAIELAHELGSITVGKRASLLFFKAQTSLVKIPYHFSMSKPFKVMIDGVVVD
jgi:imidazolonepropionase